MDAEGRQPLSNHPFIHPSTLCRPTTRTLRAPNISWGPRKPCSPPPHPPHPSPARAHLALAHVKHLLELAQAVGGLHGVQVGHHGAVLLPVAAEVLRVHDKGLDLLDELALEADLRSGG